MMTVILGTKKCFKDFFFLSWIYFIQLQPQHLDMQQKIWLYTRKLSNIFLLTAVSYGEIYWDGEKVTGTHIYPVFKLHSVLDSWIKKPIKLTHWNPILLLPLKFSQWNSLLGIFKILPSHSLRNRNSKSCLQILTPVNPNKLITYSPIKSTLFLKPLEVLASHHAVS